MSAGTVATRGKMFNMIEEYADRRDRFESLKEHKPQSGDILTSKDGRAVPVYVESYPSTGKRSMYTNALIDEERTGWYLTTEPRGLKCLILPWSQEELIYGNGGSTNKLFVSVLKVVRINDKETALMCELVKDKP